MTSQLPVLIVGAGPTGLMMACEMARFGIPFRIIDKKSEPTQTTNAAGIQTRTLEILQHIGVINRFLEAGLKCDQFRMHNDRKTLATLSLDMIDSPYKFILLLPQSMTEKFLTEHLQTLGSEIERSLELIDLHQARGQVISKIKHADGSIEVVNSGWVIGCDGYHSTVREKANITMMGDDIEQEFLVADVVIKTELTTRAVDVFLCRGILLGLFPLGDDRYRIVANLGSDKKVKQFTHEELAAIVKERTNSLCEVTDVLWSSPFWIHSKVAEKLFNQSVFIAGDAAHVHSPAGAQGMNTGLQDAYNLAWKLALVIKGNLHSQALASYQEERLPFIKNLVTVTEKMSHLALAQSDIILNLRSFLIENVAGKSNFIQSKMASRITQLSLSYKKSSLINYDSCASKILKPGKRLVDAKFDNGNELYSLIRNNMHNLLLFTYEDANASEIASAICQWISATYPELVVVHVISKQSIAEGAIADNNLSVHQRYGIHQPSMCLVRPDHYIAFSKAAMDQDALKQYFAMISLK